MWRLAKLFGDDRRRMLSAAGVDAATLDLLSVLRRAGHPYRLTTRQVTDGLVERGPVARSRAVAVTLTAAGHALVDRFVDQGLGLGAIQARS